MRTLVAADAPLGTMITVCGSAGTWRGTLRRQASFSSPRNRPYASKAGSYTPFPRECRHHIRSYYAIPFSNKDRTFVQAPVPAFPVLVEGTLRCRLFLQPPISWFVLSHRCPSGNRFSRHRWQILARTTMGPNFYVRSRYLPPVSTGEDTNGRSLRKQLARRVSCSTRMRSVATPMRYSGGIRHDPRELRYQRGHLA